MERPTGHALCQIMPVCPCVGHLVGKQQAVSAICPRSIVFSRKQHQDVTKAVWPQYLYLLANTHAPVVASKEYAGALIFQESSIRTARPLINDVSVNSLMYTV